jgi:MinD superfamily P-loop ATPase
LEVLGRIPEDRRIAESYSRGEIIIQALPEYIPTFQNLAINIGRTFGETVIGGKK